MADTLIELAERCEKATGPDRELDVAIGLAGRFYIAEPRYPGATPMIGYVDDEGCRVEPGNGAQNRLVPEYTASLDAAMTLVLEGWNVQFERTGKASRACVWKAARNHSRYAATSALALCAAALRARAAMKAAS